MAKAEPIALLPDVERRKAEAAKTARLRALRIAKEVADREEAAAREAAASVNRPKRARPRAPKPAEEKTTRP